MRGNLVENGYAKGSLGSIPARAGEPCIRCPRRHWTRVYPRACGGTGKRNGHGLNQKGLSPRVRGNPTDVSAAQGFLGSIPARAGEPLPYRAPASVSRVYPRACGGTSPKVSLPASSTGLSPRVRGNRLGKLRKPGQQGSIPARAGEPRIIGGRRAGIGVYPRACGGTVAGKPATVRETGLSPRVRGNRRPAG